MAGLNTLAAASVVRSVRVVLCLLLVPAPAAAHVEAWTLEDEADTSVGLSISGIGLDAAFLPVLVMNTVDLARGGRAGKARVWAGVVGGLAQTAIGIATLYTPGTYDRLQSGYATTARQLAQASGGTTLVLGVANLVVAALHAWLPVPASRPSDPPGPSITSLSPGCYRDPSGLVGYGLAFTGTW